MGPAAAPPAAAPAALQQQHQAPDAGGNHQPPTRRHRILMVSDFFYPNFGGVENHIYQLSQCLLDAGHKVVVMTHAYGDCGGVRYLTNGLKVYYLYRRPIYAQSTLPTWVGAFRLLRLICLREGISLVHCHQAFSTLGGEALLQARTMGYKVVFTDHSLFGFADAASIFTNKLIKGVLADVQHVICVSHTSKENTVLRACLHPAAVSVIPNAVDASEFEPTPASVAAWPRSPSAPITIVALSRLVYRKGVDILALVIPEVCHRHPHVNFVIGGDGPKRSLLQQMVTTEGLEARVTLAGAIPHEHARDFLVLPPDMMLLAEPSPDDLLAVVEAAIQQVPHLDPHAQHERVKEMYNWPNVAQRTAAVYDLIAPSDAPLGTGRPQAFSPGELLAPDAPSGPVHPQTPSSCHRRSSSDSELLARLRRYRSIGAWAGLVFCCIVLWLHWFWHLLEWQQPAAEVDVAVDWPTGGGGCGHEPWEEQQLPHQEQEQVLGVKEEEDGGKGARRRRARQHL